MTEKIKNKQLGINIEFADLKLVSFETTARIQELKVALEKKDYEFNFNFRSTMNDVQRLINVILTITVSEKQTELVRVPLAKLEILISFRIDNWKEVITIDKENNKVNIPDDLIAVTAGVAVSTARGMLAVKTQNTIISNAIIPIVDPRMFIPKKP